MNKRRLDRDKTWPLGFAIGCSCLLCLLFAFNAYYDPYLVFARADALPATHNDQRGALSSYSYVAKAAQIVREKPIYILLGSSVTDGGFRGPGSMANYFDPDPEVSRTLQLLIDPHPPIYNGALRGKHVSEAYDYLLHAYANNPGLKEVYLGIDWTLFIGTPQTLQNTVSILGHTHVTLDYLLQYSLSWSSTKLSFNMWESDHGNRVRQFGRIVSRAAAFLRAILPAAFAEEAPHFAPQPGQDVNHVLHGDYEFQTHNFIFTAWFISGLKQAVVKSPPGSITYGETEYLEKIVAFCREKQIKLTVFVTPKHPFFWAFLDHWGLMGYPENWLRQVVRITPVWDFSGAVDFGPDPDKYFRLDSLHFIHTGGELMLPQLIGEKPSIPGATIVTPENVEQIILEDREGLKRWETAHPVLEQSVLAISEASVETMLKQNLLPSHIPLMPVVYQPDYKGYRIFKCMNRFIAVPVAWANSLSLNDAIQYQNHHWPSADTLDNLVTLLKSGII